MAKKPKDIERATSFKIGQKVDIPGRGVGTVRGVMVNAGTYFIRDEGQYFDIKEVRGVCFKFDDQRSGACPNPSNPSSSYWLAGYGLMVKVYRPHLRWAELKENGEA